MRASLACLTAVLFWDSAGRASEFDALAISANIQARHMPFATLLDPIYASPTSDQIIGYTRCGDSALWTGAYLAAESFRYKVTQSADALQNVKRALAGLKALADVTGDNRLARCAVMASSPYAAGIASEEANNGIHQNAPWIWVDRAGCKDRGASSQRISYRPKESAGTIGSSGTLPFPARTLSPAARR